MVSFLVRARTIRALLRLVHHVRFQLRKEPSLSASVATSAFTSWAVSVVDRRLDAVLERTDLR